MSNELDLSNNINLFNGDCLEVMKGIPDGSVDLIVTDPPYKITGRGGYTSAGGMMLDDTVRKGKVFKENSVTINDYLPDFYRVLKEGSHCYIMCNNKNLADFLAAVTFSDFHLIKTLVWAKNNKIMSQAYMSQTEFIIFLRKGAFKKINSCGTSDLLNFDNPRNKVHPTEKPVELMQILIENSSDVGDLILDPFAGSFPVGVACVNSGRDCIGIELDKEYYGIAKERTDKIANTEQLM